MLTIEMTERWNLMWKTKKMYIKSCVSVVFLFEDVIPQISSFVKNFTESHGLLSCSPFYQTTEVTLLQLNFSHYRWATPSTEEGNKMWLKYANEKKRKQVCGTRNKPSNVFSFKTQVFCKSSQISA